VVWPLPSQRKFYSLEHMEWYPCASELEWEPLLSSNTLGTEVLLEVLPRQPCFGTRQGHYRIIHMGHPAPVVVQVDKSRDFTLENVNTDDTVRERMGYWATPTVPCS
jgi:hypothetical protein